jgi:hypothetical protein
MPWSPATMQVGGRGARGGGRRRWPSCKRQLVYSVLCPTHAWGGGKRAQDPRPFPSCPWLRGAAEGVKARQQAIHERLQLYWGEVEAASQRVAVEAARGRAGERGRACSCLGLSCSRGGRGACSCQQDMLPAAAPTCASCPHMRQLPPHAPAALQLLCRPGGGGRRSFPAAANTHVPASLRLLCRPRGGGRRSFPAATYARQPLSRRGCPGGGGHPSSYPVPARRSRPPAAAAAAQAAGRRAGARGMEEPQAVGGALGGAGLHARGAQSDVGVPCSTQSAARVCRA